MLTNINRNSQMYRAHKIELRPTSVQESYLRQACGTKRFIYNKCLDHWAT